MAEHVKVLELDDEEYILGLANPLKIKYKDSKNILHDFEYSGSELNGSINIQGDPEANNLNTIDLSSGVYYATTAATASKVSNPLTIHTPDGDIIYDGGVPDVEITLPGKNLVEVINVTYDELIEMRNNGKLISSSKYRIIDYETIVNQSGVTSAGHVFDIIVDALSNDVLSEDAIACPSERSYTISTTSQEIYTANHVSNDWIKITEDSDIEVPEGIQNLQDGGFDYVYYKQCDLTCKKGSLSILVQWTGGSWALHPIGFELIKNGEIVSQDYHIASTGNSNNRNTFQLNVPTNGIYTIRYYIDAGSESVPDQINSNCKVVFNEYPAISYFQNNQLSVWDIKYSLDNNTNRFAWANNSGKGVIYYMKDEYGNEATYDFKNVLYNGFYTFNYNIDGTNYDGSVKYGHKCFGNKLCSDLTDEVGTNKPGLPKIIFKNRYQDSVCKFNNFSSNSWNIVFGNNCSSNIFKGKAENLSFADDCILNTFGENCVGIELNNACSHNLFGNDCESIKLGQNCSYNVFGHYCKSNELKADCSYNTFGDYCTSNQINNESTNNSFGYNCTNNILASNCTENIFGAKCSNNKMGPNCQSNLFDSDCKDNILGCDDNWTFPSNISQASEGQCYANQFGYNCVNICMKNGCSYNIFGSKCGIDGFTNENLGNKFHRNCSSNNFGSNCAGNTFGEYSSYNDIGDFAVSNIFGNACQSNIFGIACQSNTFGDYMLRCKLGNKCINCKITSSEVGDTLLTHLKLIEFDNECNNVNLWVNSIDITNYLQNYKLEGNLTGNIQITGDSPRNRSYVTTITSNSNGQIIQKCLGDTQSLITNYSNGILTISL